MGQRPSRRLVPGGRFVFKTFANGDAILLVLTRRLNDKTRIMLPDGREIIVTLVAVGPLKCKLGFDAPPDVQVVRPEAHDQEPRLVRGIGKSVTE